MSKPSDTIESREPRYGDYYERSELKERIVEAFSEGRNWMGLEPDARNSLMMIADKLSRILNGDADDPDSWHDIGGYAGLIEKRLNDDWSSRINEGGAGVIKAKVFHETCLGAQVRNDIGKKIGTVESVTPVAGGGYSVGINLDEPLEEFQPLSAGYRKAPTRCPYFTGTPPSWDDIEGGWLVQDADGEFKSYTCRPEPREDLPWWGDNRLVLQGGDVFGKGPRNPHWKLAIEPRPETHK